MLIEATEPGTRGHDASVSGHCHNTEKHEDGSNSSNGQPYAIDETVPADPGVRKVEAFNKFGYALDYGITSQFNAIASSSFGHHAELGAVNTASVIIRGVSQPFIGKLADITSRPTAYVVVLVFYVIGFVVAATCNNIAAYTVGICFTSFGKSGLDFLGDVIVGDLTPLQWRVFWNGLLVGPFLITTFVNGFISDAFIPEKWRWGLGMFAIIMPVMMVPAIMSLYGIQAKADKLGMISISGPKTTSKKDNKFKDPAAYIRVAWQGIIDIDLAGIILLSFSWSLILLPLNLAQSAKGGWENASMIAMILCGFLIFILFGLFEVYIAPKPVMTRAILHNKAFVYAVIVDVFNLMASGVNENYLPSYMYIIKEWSNYIWTIFLGITTLTICFVGPIAGIIHRLTHRYKTLMVFGGVVKLVGYAISMESNMRSTQSVATLAISQILLGIGSLSVFGARLGSQASVPHKDMASAIAIASLWTTIGNSVGYTIATTIWTEHMLGYMREECPPDTPDSTLREIYGSISVLRTKCGWEDPIRQGAVSAYTRTNGLIVTTACVLSVIPIIFSCLMPDYYLGKQQNAVTNTGLDGELLQVPAHATCENEERAASKQGIWSKVKSFYYREV
ncbi:hypothetical protein V495_08729 [Pseudogymnoascus sp. VKM F-4514 (FW-929)]|nr:hypothetical protein V495_08729 [Pseudogymnoascus sp. VKM F-4514 (FW-929)]KFY59883.1 hypothetical protein V497_04037 [Pseudogymnoascus sp. VKM F-4516 (FW-969)]